MPVPCVVCGRIEAAEDVDYFKFHAEAGQTLTFEVLCARLQDKIHDLQKHADPMLTLFDADGRELAANDDFYFADPLLSYTFTQDRRLLHPGPRFQVRRRPALGLRPARDQSAVCHARLPDGRQPGADDRGRAGRLARLIKPQVALHVPPRSWACSRCSSTSAAARRTRCRSSSASCRRCWSRSRTTRRRQATRVTMPCGINGRIGKTRDLDHFVFAAKKGKAIRFEVKARRFGTLLLSSLDSVLDVLTPKGQGAGQQRRRHGKDAALVFTPPADGDYVAPHPRSEQQGRADGGLLRRGRLGPARLHACAATPTRR